MEYFRSVIALERSQSSSQKCNHDINNADDSSDHNNSNSNSHNEFILRKTKSKPKICRRFRHHLFSSPSSNLNMNNNNNNNSNSNANNSHIHHDHHNLQTASFSATPKLYSYSSQVLFPPQRCSNRHSNNERHYSETIAEMQIPTIEDAIHEMDFSQGNAGVHSSTCSSTTTVPSTPSTSRTCSACSTAGFGLRLASLEPTTATSIAMVEASSHNQSHNTIDIDNCYGGSYDERDGNNADDDEGDDNDDGAGSGSGSAAVSVANAVTPASRSVWLLNLNLNLNLSSFNEAPDLEAEEEEEEEDDCHNDNELLQMQTKMDKLQMGIDNHQPAYDIILNSMDANTKLTVEKLSASSFESQHYRKMGDCGAGAFGVVSKEFHLPSCKVVAIKSSLASNTDAVKQFKKEIAIFHQLQDTPFIVNMIDCGFDAELNQMRIAMEFMDLASLTSVMTMTTSESHVSSAYSVSAVKHISYCVLSALSALHALLYVHNDVKPANILLNHRFEVKLSDFGCVQKMVNVETPLTTAVGTLKYRSYEQRFITPIAYTTKTDIYSFGITVYELLNGLHCKSNNDNNNNNNTVDVDVDVYYEPPQLRASTSATEVHGFDANTIDFVSKCVDTDYKSRWSATQLLLHPFFDDYTHSHSESQTTDGNHSDGQSVSVCGFRFETLATCASTVLHENKIDLEFMIESLIEYYTSYSDPNLMPLKSTPIDFLFSDKERVQAMASHTGYPSQRIRNCIRQCISSHSRQYLSPSRSKSGGRANYDNI